YDFGNGLSLGAGLRYTGESYANADNSRKVDDFLLVDMTAAYEFGDGYEARLGVTNVGDKRHVTGCKDLYVCSYGSGREISVAVTKQF
ncbi:MAG TPA: TonB-dependent siderophore receptor, partial [Citreicella sp.]|nr:TonB-dependent siderophore receptor [Citreicella sp.]